MVKISFAGSSEIENYFDEMMFVLDALDTIQEGWAGSLLTDESSVSDFLMTPEELKKFKKALGVPVKDSNTILSLCKKLRKKKSK